MQNQGQLLKVLGEANFFPNCYLKPSSNESFPDEVIVQCFLIWLARHLEPSPPHKHR